MTPDELTSWLRKLAGDQQKIERKGAQLGANQAKQGMSGVAAANRVHRAGGRFKVVGRVDATRVLDATRIGVMDGIEEALK